MFEFDRKTGEFSWSSDATLTWRAWIEVDGRRLGSSGAEVTAGIPEDDGPTWVLHFEGCPVRWEISGVADEDGSTLRLSSRICNDGASPVTLGQVALFDTSDLTPITAPDDELVVLPGRSSQQSLAPFRFGSSESWGPSQIRALFYNRTRNLALHIGFSTFLRANTLIHWEGEAETGPTRLWATADFSDWILEPGCTDTEELMIAVGDDPSAQLELWGTRAAEACSPRKWGDPPIGWIGWTWVDAFNCETYEDVVFRNCEAINRRLAGFGVEYVWESIGNLPNGQPGEWLDWNYEAFPHGVEYLVSRLHDMGFKLGFWCGPFWMSSHLKERVEEMREALLCGSDGSPHVSSRNWSHGRMAGLPPDEQPVFYALDPTHPKTLTWLEHTFLTWRRWGVRYYTVDFLYAGAGNISDQPNHAADRSLVGGPEGFQKAMQVIRKAAGDDTYILASTGPTLHTAGVCDAVRTGSDFGEGRALFPGRNFYPATFTINEAGSWVGPRWALINQAATWFTHRKLYINDSGNVLSVDKPIPLENARTHATIHALSGGPSMIGDDVDRMDPQRLELIKMTLPRPHDVAFPVDLLDCPLPDYPKVFHRHVSLPWGAYDVVAVYNLGAEGLTQHISLDQLGLDAEQDHLVWEFWDGRYLGRIQEGFDAWVPPGGVRVYRVAADPGRPILLGTDMHILMGEVEMAECDWCEETRTLSGRASRPSGECGNLFLHAPSTVALANPQGHWIAKDGGDESLIIRVALDFPKGVADWAVSFKEL